MPENKPSLLNLTERITNDVGRALGKLLGEKYGLIVLGVISYAESALPVPLITDPFMVAYIIAHRSRVVLGVMVTAITSVLGGLSAFLVAAFFIDTLIGYASPEILAEFNELATRYPSGFLLGFLGALTPIPFTVASIAAGALQGNVFGFIVGALIGRIIRYGITGYLTYHFGKPALLLAQKNIKLVSVAAIVFALLYVWFVIM